MRIKKKKSFLISKDLKILRAFVDAIRVVGDDIFISVAYRKGRAFCRYSKDLKLKFRIEEEYLAKMGFGDFRAFTVDKKGNLIVTGITSSDVISYFEINGEGKISRSAYIPDFPLLESADISSDGFLYLHSPIKEHPVYRFSPNLEPAGPIGKYPPGESNVTRRIAMIGLNGNDNLTMIFENNPVYVHRYSSDGEEVFSRKLKSETYSIDHITQALDFTINPEDGFLYILRDTGNKEERTIEVLDKSGEPADSFSVPLSTRRIHLAKGNILYTSGTVFGIHGMILSKGIYGAITTIDIYKLSK